MSSILHNDNDNDCIQVSIAAVGAVQDAVLSTSDTSDKHSGNSNSEHPVVTTLSTLPATTTTAAAEVATTVTSSDGTTTATIATTTTEADESLSQASFLAKPTIVLLPPVEIDEKPKTLRKVSDDSNKENIDPQLKKTPATTTPSRTAKSGTTTATAAAARAKAVSVTAASRTAKPTTSTTTLGTKKPLSSSTGRAASTTTATTLATGSVSRSKSTNSSLTKTPLSSSTTVKPRPPIPASLRATASTASSVRTAATSSIRSTTPSSVRSTTPSSVRSTTASSTARTLAPPTTSSTLRKSPSSPSLSSSSSATSPTTARALASAGRRVASSSGVETRSSVRSSPLSTPRPTPTRSTSSASIASTSTATTSASATARRPLTTTASSPGSTASRMTAASGTARATASSTLGVRKTPTSSTTSSPTSTLRASTVTRTATRPTAAQTMTPTPVRKTITSSATTASTRSTPTTSTRSPLTTSTRPVTDATKVKMLTTQLTGLQEKHDQTLKLLQEQEERLKAELEELASAPEHERKPIPSDKDAVLQEMEELRTQFQNAKAQHEKALEDIATERASEIALLKEAHEAILAVLTKERDSITESLNVLQESSDSTDQEKSEKIKALEEQLESTHESQTKAVAQHAEALESLRAEIESAWTLKLESKIQELSKEHEEQLKGVEETAETTGNSMETEINTLKVSFAQQIKDMEDENESRILELIAKHESEVQEWKDKLTNESDAHEEAMAQLQKDHSEETERLNNELTTSQEANADLKTRLEGAESELERAHAEKQDELTGIRAEMNEIRKLLALKEAETAELEKRVQELSDDLEKASISTILKNTDKYKVKPVQVYGSTVSGNLHIKRAQQTINHALEQLDIQYEFVDVSSSEEAKRFMRRKSLGEKQLPQIFSGGEYCGVFDDFEYAIETHQLIQFLGFDRVKSFVPQHRVEHGQSVAQDGEDAEQGAGRPDVVVNGMSNHLTTVGLHSHSNGKYNNIVNKNNGGDTATSMYLMAPGSNRFRSKSTSAMSSNGSVRANKKSGFVQTASQVWDGALREGVTHAKHDLGLSSTVIPDDDELDELFEQGAVSEAELEAMLASVSV